VQGLLDLPLDAAAARLGINATSMKKASNNGALLLPDETAVTQGSCHLGLLRLSF
jgi:hypothetical protein